MANNCEIKVMYRMYIYHLVCVNVPRRNSELSFVYVTVKTNSTFLNDILIISMMYRVKNNGPSTEPSYIPYQICKWYSFCDLLNVFF